jgi:CheY-like chemotaxis protein
VLIDLHMLLPDGIAALHEIAGSFASGRAPVLIALLDQAGPGDVPRVLEAGARACLRKPLDGHELTTLLEAMGAAR